MPISYYGHSFGIAGSDGNLNDVGLYAEEGALPYNFSPFV